MSTIEKNVMASVRMIYMFRLLGSRLLLECYVLILSCVGIVTLVSIPHVLQNFSIVASSGLAGIGAFLFSAIVGTRIVVQVALLLGGGAFCFLLADIIRSLRLTPSHFQKSSLV